ncbi:unnamed protein product [Amoebophrya sp. A25]|nr:unnamed protein product [Amoebophrya sp. A25]|eukprot:GSA25T00005401001.1
MLYTGAWAKKMCGTEMDGGPGGADLVHLSCESADAIPGQPQTQASGAGDAREYPTEATVENHTLLSAGAKNGSAAALVGKPDDTVVPERSMSVF